MKKLTILIFLILMMAFPASASELTAPSVPERAESYMPSDPQNLGQGILEVLKEAVHQIRPDIKEASGVCLGIMAACMILCMVQNFPGITSQAVNLAGAVVIGLLVLESVHSMIHLGSDTVKEISEYGKLLLPVMTAALSAQGGVTASAALYGGTAAFDAILAGLISKILIPMIYIFLALSVCCAAMEEELLKKFRDMIKSATIWLLKVILYIFTGYISLTGVISGTTDAAALKAAKMTISGVVPVVGGILSDASEAVLVGAGTVKNAVGMYGLFAILAIWIGPFLKIGTHYLLLKATGIVSGIFSGKQIASLIQDFSAAMGLMLAMTGTVCLLLMISMVCFMKGVS